MTARYLLVAVTLSLLTGCGLIAAFVPPIEVNDPFGVDGETIVTTLQDPSAMSVQVESVASYTSDLPSQDQEIEDLRGFSIAWLEVNIGLEATVTLSRVDLTSEFPETFALTKLQASAEVSDEVNGEVALKVTRDLEGLTFSKGSCDAAGLECAYTFDGSAEEIVSALTVRFEDTGKIMKLIDIIKLKESNTPNTGKFGLVLTADSEPGMAGFQATLTLVNESTKIKLGG